MKVKRFLFPLFVTCLCVGCGQNSFQNNVTENTNQNYEISSEIVSDDSLEKDEKSSSKGFSANLSGTDYTTRFNLTQDQGFWKVVVKNTGTNPITFVAEGAKTSNAIRINAGQTKEIYNTSKWPAGTYYANFTCGGGMKGAASCRTATTIGELELSNATAIVDVEELPSPKAVTQAFSVNLNHTGTTYTTRFNLSSQQGYWKVMIKNTGKKPIIYTTEGAQNSSVYKIPTGKTQIVYSKTKWLAGTYTANFSSDDSLSGNATCTIASTFEELNIPS